MKWYGPRPRPQTYQAPSWSWASVNEGVENFTIIDSKPLATVIDFDVTLAGSLKFGRVSDGYVRIRGSLTQATFQASDEILRDKWNEEKVHVLTLRARNRNDSLTLVTLIPDIRVAVDFGNGFPSYPIRGAIGSRKFYLLPICGDQTVWIGLILQRTDLATRGQYWRLGSFIQLKEEKSTEAFRSHIPFLDFQDYEDYDDHGYTISII